MDYLILSIAITLFGLLIYHRHDIYTSVYPEEVGGGVVVYTDEIRMKNGDYKGNEFLQGPVTKTTQHFNGEALKGLETQLLGLDKGI